MRSSQFFSQELVGGIVLVALGLVGLYAGSGLKIGSLAGMGPGFFPILLSVMVLAVGIGLVLLGVLREGEAIEPMMPTRVAMIAAAIIAFGLLVRGASLGALEIPSCGVFVAAPICMIISGFSVGRPRLLPLLANALVMPGLAILLFADLLSLPMPVYPDALRQSLPAGWSEKFTLRIIVSAMVAAGAVLAILSQMRSRQVKTPE